MNYFESNPSSKRDWMRELFLSAQHSHMTDAMAYALSGWDESKVDRVKQFHVELTPFDRELLQGMKISI